MRIPERHVKKVIYENGLSETQISITHMSVLLEANCASIQAVMETLSWTIFDSSIGQLSHEDWLIVHHNAVRNYIKTNLRGNLQVQN